MRTDHSYQEGREGDLTASRGKLLALALQKEGLVVVEVGEEG